MSMNSDSEVVVTSAVVKEAKEEEEENEVKENENKKEKVDEDPNKIPVCHSRVGEQYQAVIPEESRDDSLVEEHGEIECVWDYSKIPGDKLDEYMEKVRDVDPPVPKEVFSIEKALTLLHQTNYDVEKALEAAKEDSSRIVDLDMKWDNGDCNMFEYAYLHIGSDLNEVAKFLKPKTVAQVQRHYYHWKYGKRYKRFLEKNYLISSSDEEKEEEEEEKMLAKEKEKEDEKKAVKEESQPPQKIIKIDN